MDAGYAQEYGYMGPYKNTRYHLDDFRGLDLETLSRQEKFNLTHSRLRNVVEQTFGVLKARWHILEGVPYCEREKQSMMIISCFAMNNFFGCVSMELVHLRTHCPIGCISMQIIV